MPVLDKIIEDNEELISVSMISEATMSPVIVVRFIDGTKSMLKISQSLTNIKGLVINELKLYRVRQRRKKIMKVLNVSR